MEFVHLWFVAEDDEEDDEEVPTGPLVLLFSPATSLLLSPLGVSLSVPVAYKWQVGNGRRVRECRVSECSV